MLKDSMGKEIKNGNMLLVSKRPKRPHYGLAYKKNGKMMINIGRLIVHPYSCNPSPNDVELTTELVDKYEIMVIKENSNDWFKQ